MTSEEVMRADFARYVECGGRADWVTWRERYAADYACEVVR